MRWVSTSQGADARLARIFPDEFASLTIFWQEHRPPAHGKVPHLHHHHGAMKNAFGGLLATHALHAQLDSPHLVNLLASRRRFTLASCHHGRDHGQRPGPRTMIPHQGYMLAADRSPSTGVSQDDGFDPLSLGVHQRRAPRCLAW